MYGIIYRIVGSDEYWQNYCTLSALITSTIHTTDFHYYKDNYSYLHIKNGALTPIKRLRYRRSSFWCTIVMLHFMQCLTHWGQVMHMWIGKLTIIDSDNGLLPGRLQAIIWTNAGILLIWPIGTNFSEISIKIHISIQENAFQSVVCEMSAILS